MARRSGYPATSAAASTTNFHNTLSPQSSIILSNEPPSSTPRVTRKVKYDLPEIGKHKAVIPWVEMASGVYRNSDLVRTLSRVFAISDFNLTESTVVFADGEPKDCYPRATVPTGGVELFVSTPELMKAAVTYLLDPRCAVDISRARKLNLLQRGAPGPNEHNPAVAAALVRKMHKTLESLNISSPWLDGRRMMGWSPLSLAPSLRFLRFTFDRHRDRRYAPEVLREVFRDLTHAIPLEELYVELTLPLAAPPELHYLGQPAPKNDDNDLSQEPKWRAFAMTLGAKTKFLKNFKGADIVVIGEGADNLEEWLDDLKKRDMVTVWREGTIDPDQWQF
ncbi:uncharacterized protein SCHCODRAFT_02749963 [Schizophyllum commune H4-8]|uniref:Uncharacterized protein n=1 Tax=Schizophyllum commune (strain H4-8 / FGSC 9210) TaxID=578458 RepID=D8QA57_SCHCM|nr:uncharacterized protein SCHCODRAFT_02749963 [Schizophyllum commune H4-8]KAI5890137.1 hypothetical protein SCHCODRAFT_02749963 [Schizophyllum commune H4-8]